LTTTEVHATQRTLNRVVALLLLLPTAEVLVEVVAVRTVAVAMGSVMKARMANERALTKRADPKKAKEENQRQTAINSIILTSLGRRRAVGASLDSRCLLMTLLASMGCCG